MVNKFAILTLLNLLFFINSQITVLGPPSVVNKVKELEDGSKSNLKINNF